jgi:hypothetical protein
LKHKFIGYFARTLIYFGAIFLAGCGDHQPHPAPDAKSAVERLCKYITATSQRGLEYQLKECQDRHEVRAEGRDLWYVQAKPPYRPHTWFVYSVRKSDGAVKENSVAEFDSTYWGHWDSPKIP